MKSTCGQCGTENLESAKFCARCGHPFSGPLVQSATRLTELMRKWRRLNQAMTRRELRALLGEPLRIDAPGGAASETWQYEYEPAAAGPRVAGQVLVSVVESRVIGWTEPDWERMNG